MATQKKWKRSHRDVNLYFEGYEKQTKADPLTGKQRSEYVYVGDYYLFRLSGEQFLRYRMFSALMTLGGTAAFVAAGILGPQGSVKLYSGLPALISLIPLCYLLLGVWGLIRNGSPKMTIRDYAFGMGRMKNSLWVVILLWLVSAAGQLVYMVSNRDFALLEVGCAALELIAAALLIVQWKVQGRVMEACVHEAKSQYYENDSDESAKGDL